MTEYIAYLIKFIFRIKWWLLLVPFGAALLVYSYMGSRPRSYKSTTTIYTGVVSGYDLETGDGIRQDWNVINNAMDNLINIILSQSTLNNVSKHLYARNMVYGDAKQDNNYILARNYRDEVGRTPKVVLDLIDRSSVNNTVERLTAFETADHDNHIYGLFHWTHRYYSYDALSKIKVKRVGNSDMLEVSYENDDPGIVFSTLELLNEEFVKQYKDLRFGETNNVIKFFESELVRVGSELSGQEDSLRDYNIANLIINYEEQTKHVAILSRDFELQYESIKLNLNSSEKLRQTIETQIDGLKTFRNNADFIKRLHTIGDLQFNITTAEQLPSGKPGAVTDLRNRLGSETDSLRKLTAAIASERYTKEGMSNASLVQQWLDATLLATKSGAEMKVIEEWRDSLDKRYVQYAPVGSTLKRKNRLINFTERSYLSILEALNAARLRQKNLQMSSATLKIINPPVLPISAEPTKRKIMVFATFFCTLIFILGFFLLLELLDRTLRDKIRAERITGGKVIGALPAPGRLGQRRFTKQYLDTAIRYLSNAALNYYQVGRRPNIIGILSTEPGDGKSFLAETLATHLRESGMQVCILSWNKDFDPEQRQYLMAERTEQLIKSPATQTAYAEADIVLVEYPPLSKHSIPRELLREATLNILVAPANRTWKETDQLLYEKSVALSDGVPTAICLNYAARDTVQTFTGMLPPFTRMRKLTYQLGQFGFTGIK